MSEATIEITALSTLSAIPPEDWDACACPEGCGRRAAY